MELMHVEESFSFPDRDALSMSKSHNHSKPFRQRPSKHQGLPCDIISILPSFMRCVAVKSISSQSKRAFRVQSKFRMAATLNSENISKITQKEKEITGKDEPVKGGPTSQAQSHAGEPINSQTLSDITKGEKVITGGERIKGGPTAEAQSILSKVYSSRIGSVDIS